MTLSKGSYPGGKVGFVLDMIVDGLYYYCKPTESDEQQQGPSCVVAPGWSSCMCGKKTSWIQLKHVVTELLGPAHVCATEFTPGHLTRWFLAWTFEQPQMKSPLAHTEQWEFTVEETPWEQVMSRIEDYCANLPCWKVSTIIVGDGRLEIQEAEPTSHQCVDDKLLPDRIQQIVARMDPALRFKFLPPQGHFLIDITLAANGGGGQVHESLQAYMHSTHGEQTVEKIKHQVQREICRTHRRWRRKVKRRKVKRLEESAMD
jgi:hypothetical protein